jgi:ATP-dependent Clp protease ATP-binding subunit ClpB
MRECPLISPTGSDILAEPGASNDDGVVTPEARAAVLARTATFLPPELLNRLDETLVFNKLSRASILQVVDLRLRDVAAHITDRRMTLDVDASARAWLAERGFSDVYGARAIARTVRTEVLFPMAQKIIRGTIRFVKAFLVVFQLLTLW